MTPRLMDANAVAAYLDMGRSTFDLKRKALEARGFPEPSLSRDEFGAAKWDRHAIDAWLDGRLHQLKVTITPEAPAPARDNWENKLIARATGAGLQP